MNRPRGSFGFSRDEAGRNIGAAMKTYSAAEPLEPRIAPAVLIDANNAQVAKFTDVDGDAVVIKITKGVFSPNDFTAMSVGSADVLQVIDLADPQFISANLTVTAKR